MSMKKSTRRKYLTAALFVAATAAVFAGDIVVEPGGVSPKEALEKIRAAKAAGDKSAFHGYFE